MPIQIYRELLVPSFTKAQKARRDELVSMPANTTTPPHRRQAIDDLDQKLMCAPGGTIDGVAGFPALAAASGLIRANKQVHEEAMHIFFSCNTFVCLVDLGSTYYQYPYQIFDLPWHPSCMAKIRDLRLMVQDMIVPEQRARDRAVQVLKRHMTNTIQRIDTYCHSLSSLSIRYVSAYLGEIETTRREIDALLTHPRAKPVMLQRGTDHRIDTVKHSNFRSFFASQYNFADALCAMTRTLKSVDIGGDLPGEALNRIEAKFGLPLSTAGSTVGFQTHGAAVHEETGQSRDSLAELLRDMALRDPGNEFIADMARRTSNRPVYSPAVQAMLFGPPTAEELAAMGGGGGGRGARAARGGRGNRRG